jgi:hypothetical protein
MNRLYLNIVCMVLGMAGVGGVKAGCNAPNIGLVTLTLNGSEYVTAGSTNDYTLTFSPSNVDTNGGSFAWTYTSFTVVGSSSGGSIKLVAGTPSSSLKDKTIKCEFSKAGWSSVTECSAQKKMTVVKVEVSSSSLNMEPYDTALKDDTQHAFLIQGGATWDIMLMVTPTTAKPKVNARLVQTIKGYHRRIYRSHPSGVIGRELGSTVWKYDGENGQVPPDAGAFIVLDGLDHPGLGADYLIYSSIETDFEFEDFIQYKLDSGEWITLEKGSWKTHGSSTVQSDGSGLSGGQTNTLISDFSASNDTATETPKMENCTWEDY